MLHFPEISTLDRIIVAPNMDRNAVQASVSLSRFQKFTWLSFAALALSTYSATVGNPEPCQCSGETLVCRKTQELDPKETCGSDTLKVLKIQDHDMESLGILPSPCSLQELRANFNKLKSIKELESCPDVQRLTVSYNEFLKVTSDAFPKLPQLRYLAIQSLDIRKIPSDVLQYFPELVDLDLSENSLTSISKEDFTSVPKLRSLKLSEAGLSEALIEPDALSELKHLFHLNMGRNKISNCPEGFISSLKNIEVLLFDGNKLSISCWDAISEMTQLKRLDLSRNQIESFPQNPFSKMTHLEWLSLDDNKIAILEPGIFDELTELKELRLSFNDLQSVSNLFSKLHNLEVLFLEYNPISEYTNEVFNDLHKLRTLSLYGTKVKEIPSGIFSELKSLEEINLSRMMLKSLPSNLFEGLHSLKMITIARNDLLELPEGLLSGLNELKLFDSMSNDLQNISPGFFKDQKNLLKLQLTNNKISKLPADAFSGLESVKILDLSFNPLTEFPDALKDLPTLQGLAFINCDQLPALPTYDAAVWPNLEFMNIESRSISQVPEEAVLRSWLEPPLQGTRLLNILKHMGPPSALRWAIEDPNIKIDDKYCPVATLSRTSDTGKATIILKLRVRCPSDRSANWLQMATAE